jgi:hypothetical protein
LFRRSFVSPLKKSRDSLPSPQNRQAPHKRPASPARLLNLDTCLDEEAALALSSQLPSLDPIASTFGNTRVKKFAARSSKKLKSSRQIIPQVFYSLETFHFIMGSFQAYSLNMRLLNFFNNFY